MINALRDFGVTSSMAYSAALGSIALSFFAWGTSRRKEDIPKAQRWGIFVGLWTPSLLAIGNALKLEEER